MHFRHPETIPSLVPGKTIFHKANPWCQNGWGLLAALSHF